MDAEDLRRLLTDVAEGRCRPDDAVAALRRLPFADLGHSRVDHHRHLRQGLPEAVYAPGKDPAACAAIVGELLTNGTGPVLLSRADDAQADAALTAHPGGSAHRLGAHRMVIWRPRSQGPAKPLPAGRAATDPGRSDPATSAGPEGHRVVIAAAGTADLPVAEECALTLSAYGVEPTRLNDVGVAGLHRLLDSLDVLTDADVVIVVAGMEGALASVVGGIVAAPVIAVPTSVGYGAALEGVTALLAMLSSCANGVTVTGIDNGYGAACAAMRLLLPGAKER